MNGNASCMKQTSGRMHLKGALTQPSSSTLVGRVRYREQLGQVTLSYAAHSTRVQNVK